MRNGAKLDIRCERDRVLVTIPILPASIVCCGGIIRHVVVNVCVYVYICLIVAGARRDELSALMPKSGYLNRTTTLASSERSCTGMWIGISFVCPLPCLFFIFSRRSVVWHYDFADCEHHMLLHRELFSSGYRARLHSLRSPVP